MTKQWFSDVILGPESERPAAGNPTGGAQQTSIGIYLCSDTGKIFLSTGQTWSQIGQIGGSALPPGITGDGLTPGGLVVVGALTAGDASAAEVPSFHRFNGAAVFSDTLGNLADFDDLVTVNQFSALSADASGSGVVASRTGALNGHQYQDPFVMINDTTATTAPLMRVQKQGVPQFQIDGDGFRFHGKMKSGSIENGAVGATNTKRMAVYSEDGLTLHGYVDLRAAA